MSALRGQLEEAGGTIAALGERSERIGAITRVIDGDTLDAGDRTWHAIGHRLKQAGFAPKDVHTVVVLPDAVPDDFGQSAAPGCDYGYAKTSGLDCHGGQWIFGATRHYADIDAIEDDHSILNKAVPLQPASDPQLNCLSP